MNKKHIHPHNSKIGETELYSAYKLFFNTFSGRSRLKILNLLRKNRLTVGKITAGLKEDQSRISHDLKRLKTCGFVQSEIKGKFRIYSLKTETILPILRLIDKHMKDNCLMIIQEKNRGKD